MSKKLLRFLTVTMFVLGAVLFGKVAISATTGVGDTFVASSPVMATGVTTSWTYAVPSVQVYDGSVKDDGFYQMGVSMPDRNGDGSLTAVDRFEDVGDGTVKDHLTGLIWTKNANVATGKKTWADALTYINDFNTGTYGTDSSGNCGKTDWRLPTITEFNSLSGWGIWYRNSNLPAVPTGADTIFSNIQAIVDPSATVSLCFYWSSTTSANSSDGAATNYAWGKSFCSCQTDIILKTTTGYVWAVRNE